MTVAGPRIEVVGTAADAVPLLLGELHAALARAPQRRIGFATGRTFAPFLAAVAAAIARGELPPVFEATHLDEYRGFAPERAGGMVHELCAACPPFGAMRQQGAFVPVPCDDDPAALAAHEARLAATGGVGLWFVGIGRNGHVAFHEPGVSLELGFHRATLAASTRDDARDRFAPHAPPRFANTAGAATLLGAERVVLCAFGAAKAEVVRAALRGPVSEACPASVLQRHRDVRVVLDAAAAARIGEGSA